MNSYQYLASVIIPTYNRSILLSYTLNSLAKQTLDKELFEVIVVDDGSSDDTKEVVKQFQKKLNLSYHYQEDRGRRVSLARNTGIEHASGEICVFIDSGILLGSRCIEEHLSQYNSNTDPVTVIGYVFGFDNDNREGEVLERLIETENPDSTLNYLKTKDLFFDMRERRYKRCQDDLTKLFKPWAVYWTSNVSARRKDLLDVGLFDTNYDLNWGMEDVDLGYRLDKNNIRIVLCRGAESLHFPHVKIQDENFKQHEINKLLFRRKFNVWETYIFD